MLRTDLRLVLLALWSLLRLCVVDYRGLGRRYLAAQRPRVVEVVENIDIKDPKVHERRRLEHTRFTSIQRRRWS
jgi:hypothetical protein